VTPTGAPEFRRVCIQNDAQHLEVGNQTIAVAPSYGDQLFTDKMEADDFGPGLLFEMTDHRIADHFV
jgi:hypothetical protein